MPMNPRLPKKTSPLTTTTMNSGPARTTPLKCRKFKTTPWTVQVDGVKKPAKYALDDLLKGITVEDRVYRMRCVEAWSMVIPWHGYPLADLINRLEPNPARSMWSFDPSYAPARCSGRRIRSSTCTGLISKDSGIDEAMNPLTLFAVGVYGHKGPNQNGAPLRLVTPWKYGFKGIKAITAIRFVDRCQKQRGQRPTERIRFLCQREPECESSPLEPGNRRAPWWIRLRCSERFFPVQILAEKR